MLFTVVLGLLLVCHSNSVKGSCYDSQLSHFLSKIGAPNVHENGHSFGVNDRTPVREAVNMKFDSSTQCYVFQVHYDKDSQAHTNDRRKGALFFTRIPGYKNGATNVTLEYDVYFPPSFTWTKNGSYTNIGGKLPGLYGGSTSCGGGNDAENCFSTRYMWRDNGKGEVYMYFPQSGYHQTGISIKRHGAYGTGFRTSNFVFRKSHWHTLKQRVHLNDIGRNNGFMQVDLDGKKLFTLRNVGFRKHDSVKVMGMFFCTFFGGHDPTWGSQTDTYTLYRNFKIWVNKKNII